MKQSVLNYAHRGASEYAPENTALAFSLGILQGANALETDVRRSSDGVLYLFHDPVLDRVTDGTGAVEGHTWAQLQDLRVRHPVTEVCDKILSLEHFLQLYGWRNLHFAIEIKERGIARDVVQMLDQYQMCGKTTVTSGNLDILGQVKERNPAYRIGWLVRTPTEDELAQLIAMGGEQICPDVRQLTPALSQAWKKMGFEVRAWGCKTTELMLRALECGVVGMTVNFPDKLTAYLQSHESV